MYISRQAGFLKKAFHLSFTLFLLHIPLVHAQFPSFLKPKEDKNILHFIIHVEGVRKAVKNNIEARLTILAKPYNKNPTTAQYQTFIKQAPDQILKAMQPYAYYKPTIRSSLINAGTPNMQAVFYIQPGPVMHVTKMSITLEGEGKDEASLHKVIRKFPLKVGDPLLIKRYLRGKQAIIDTAIQEGYIKSTMTVSQVLINLDRYTSEIIIRFNTGQRYYFGNTSFTKTPYNEDYLRRYLPYEKGEPFSPAKLTTLQDDLGKSNQFRQINVLPEYNDVQNQSVPVLVQLTPAPSQSYTFGAGYGTDTGVRGTVGWNLLRVTPSGHKFQALVQASQTQNSAQAQYIIPGTRPANEEYAITGSLFNLIYPGSKSNAAQVSGSYRFHEGNFEKTYSLNALYEHYTIGSDPSQNAFILYPSGNWKYRKVDNNIFAKNGYSLALTTQGSTEAIGSTVNFAQAEVVGKFAKTIRPLHGRFYTRADVGMTAVNDIDNLPPSLQFYTGGAQSVRGYSYQSLGPGKNLIVASAEWQQEVMKNGYITFFYDTGNAFNNSADLKQSVGAGIMYVTPVGPLRLSLARTLEDEDGKNWHVVFSMGPDI